MRYKIYFNLNKGVWLVKELWRDLLSKWCFSSVWRNSAQIAPWRWREEVLRDIVPGYNWKISFNRETGGKWKFKISVYFTKKFGTFLWFNRNHWRFKTKKGHSWIWFWNGNCSGHEETMGWGCCNHLGITVIIMIKQNKDTN